MVHDFCLLKKLRPNDTLPIDLSLSSFCSTAESPTGGNHTGAFTRRPCCCCLMMTVRASEMPTSSPMDTKHRVSVSDDDVLHFAYVTVLQTHSVRLVRSASRLVLNARRNKNKVNFCPDVCGVRVHAAIERKNHVLLIDSFFDADHNAESFFKLRDYLIASMSKLVRADVDDEDKSAVGIITRRRRHR
ncbi:hypothetical protein BpHYR1_006957 [Brachionus plicatilis]|uniref:Uncharacterized protein n=1 Tax=Brachionus plicatilis TaxID=10195 RepID=A0A3M7RKI6_BRAPC|nr:hypothetical protein BpHYR1_006957 [Brachionus plicatilis]